MLNKIIITGGLGFIGSHIVVELIDAGFEVLIIDDLSNSDPEVLLSINKITGKNPVLDQFNILDYDKLKLAFQNFKPTGVIHLAALKSVNESINNPLDYYETNVSGSINVLKAMDSVGCTKIVFSSSAAVYGEPKYLPIDEEHDKKPATPYGNSKLLFEEILHDWTISNPKRHAISLRYFNPLGAHSSYLLRENTKTIPTNIMPLIIQVANNKKKYLEIYGNDYDTIDGTAVRDFIHVTDLAKAHVSAMKLHNKNRFITMNLGTGEGYTVSQLVNCFQRVNGVMIKHKFVSPRVGDASEVWADVSKASKILGWNSNKSLEDMCRDAWLCCNKL